MKKIKMFLSIVVSIIFIVAVIIGVTVFIQYREQAREDDRRAYIQLMIDAEESILNKDVQKEPEKKPDNNENNDNTNLDDIISGSINDSTIKTAFSNITMHSSSTFTATLNGEEKTYRLIGVADNGNTEKVKNILESLTQVVITYDVMKNRKGETIEQIYLWNINDTDTSNMVNLKIVKEGACSTTYVGTAYSEHPNIKYSTHFVNAYKSSMQ